MAFLFPCQASFQPSLVLAGQPISDKCKTWIAKQFADKFQHNNSQASTTSQFSHWKDPDPDSCYTTEDRDELPKTFAQALSWLQQASGYPLVAYDRCPSCSVVVFRCEFKDHKHCPRCNHARYRPGSNDKVPHARLLYSPISSYLDTLWSQPDIARYAL